MILDVFNSTLSSYPYISSYNFMMMADHLMIGNDPEVSAHPDMKNIVRTINPLSVKEGDIVYVITDLLPLFYNKIYPSIKNNFIMISGRTDNPVNRNYNTDKIIKWYTSNLGVKNDKIEAIPLGIQNRHWRTLNNPEGEPGLIDEVNKEDIEKDKDILMGFQPRTNPHIRQPIYTRFKDKSFITKSPYNNDDRKDMNFRKNYYRNIRKHKFVLCPFGAGFDCHRNWETWALGTYPIIMKHVSMENFYDMPAWFINNWDEVNEDNLYIKYQELSNGNYNTDKIKFDYWFKKIKIITNGDINKQ